MEQRLRECRRCRHRQFGISEVGADRRLFILSATGATPFGDQISAGADAAAAASAATDASAAAIAAGTIYCLRSRKACG